MIKAIFFDIDGTVYDSKAGRIPESTVACLHAMRKKGIKLFIATGRIPYMMDFIRKYFLFDGYLTLNGQYCFADDDSVLHKKPIKKEDIIKLMEMQKHTPFPCEIIESDRLFFASDVYDDWMHFDKNNDPLPIYDISRIKENDVYQILVRNDENSLKYIRKLENLTPTSAGGSIADIIPSDGGKHIGIGAVASLYGITREEVMVFGDGPNDETMISWAGTGVAMGNGHPMTKAAADYVTDDMSSDGIKNALLHFGILTEEEITQ